MNTPLSKFIKMSKEEQDKLVADMSRTEIEPELALRALQYLATPGASRDHLLEGHKDWGLPDFPSGFLTAHQDLLIKIEERFTHYIHPLYGCWLGELNILRRVKFDIDRVTGLRTAQCDFLMETADGVPTMRRRSIQQMMLNYELTASLGVLDLVVSRDIDARHDKDCRRIIANRRSIDEAVFGDDDTALPDLTVLRQAQRELTTHPLDPVSEPLRYNHAIRVMHRKYHKHCAWMLPVGPELYTSYGFIRGLLVLRQTVVVWPCRRDNDVMSLFIWLMENHRKVEASMFQREGGLAFLSGLHPRLGADSAVLRKCGASELFEPQVMYSILALAGVNVLPTDAPTSTKAVARLEHTLEPSSRARKVPKTRSASDSE